MNPSPITDYGVPNYAQLPRSPITHESEESITDQVILPNLHLANVEIVDDNKIKITDTVTGGIKILSEQEYTMDSITVLLNGFLASVSIYATPGFGI